MPGKKQINDKAIFHPLDEFESEDNEPNLNNNNGYSRRDFITLTASSMAAVGAGCCAWPLIDSFNPAADILAVSSIEVDISNIEPGQTRTVKWQGKPVFITNRTAKQIEEARDIKITDLRDPASDQTRVKAGHDNWLILIAICTHLGCVPLPGQGDYDGYFCPCHGSQYDSSGRIRQGPAPLNLAIPPYSFISDTKIKIG